MDIYPGLIGEFSITISEEHTAYHLGSGGVDVFATPAMIAMMEAAAVAAVDHLLEPGKASVGIEVQVHHLAATPLGCRVTARAEVIAIDDRRISFRLSAWDQQEIIGEGTHTRFIIDKTRFMERVAHKTC